MLQLLTSPAWAPAGQSPSPLPLTLPAALLVLLATQPGWMSREALAVVFWPDATPAEASHHLRVNLHRARSLLAAWGMVDALQAERSRLRLDLPNDLATWRAALATADADWLARHGVAGWLQGWQLPRHEGFARWADEAAHQLQAEWLQACRQSPSGRNASHSAEPGEAALPGREAQLRRLATSPSPAVLLLGEPGAGKSALLRAAHPQAPRLQCLEGLHTLPYRPVLDALRAHKATLERALRETSHPLRPYRLDLARVLPELAPDEPLPPLDVTTAKVRLVEALVRAFEALAPALAVDDLQWCDSATLEWLLLLAQSGRLRWCATARRHELTDTVASGLQSLRATARLEEIDVPPLSAEAVALACNTRWPEQQFSPKRLDRLHAFSGGNAFLLGELVLAGQAGDDGNAPSPVRQSASRLLLARLKRQSDEVRCAVEAAAVFVQAVPADALRLQLADQGAAADEAAWSTALARAVGEGLLREDGALLACRHDLVREAVFAALKPARREALHRHAALWLATQPDADALVIAEHWRAAGEPQTALAWCHRGAEQLKARGRFDDARKLWRQVAEESLDAAQGLRARLELAACDLLDNLDRGAAALDAVQAQLGAVADAEARRQIEGRMLAAQVDNRVFAGDIARASAHAHRLRELLPALPVPDRVDALEVLIELAMREPDIPAAWALLAQLRSAAPGRPTLLSFEGQIHWFGGQVQAAHDALSRLLERHPAYCSGITVENDLAVMLHALGRIDEAEAMARASLRSWAGVAHTETLSLLVLGSVLGSAGRWVEAEQALTCALMLARDQASPGFEAEALVRRARVKLLSGRAAEAQSALDTAAPLLAASQEPLRVSQLVLLQVQVALALGQALPGGALARIERLAQGSSHPLVLARLATVRVAHAQRAGEVAEAQGHAAEVVRMARAAGLQEVLAEGLLLQAMAEAPGGEPVARQALALATRLGLAGLQQRVQGWLQDRPRDP
ncbi:MAG: AAA family ATPase [Ideonella sp.]|nr:AAA family ATPase [Ideonella sp.]